jgi:hypothetical protein
MMASHWDSIGEYCMRIFFAASMIALLAAAPAYAQLNGGKAPPGPPPGPQKSQQEIKAERDAEQAYKKSLSGIPDKPAPDPWGIARGATEPKTPAKTPEAKKKPTATAN